MKKFTTTTGIFHILRVGAAMCFIGHGAFGIITKPIWCNYFAVFGIGHDMAYRLMPVVGTGDILMGLSLLFYPTRAIASWLVIWGLVTAALRPLSGEPFAEFIERGGNYGVPAALLLLCGGFAGFKSLFSRLRPPQDVEANKFERVFWCLRIAVCLLFVGHGWLNLIGKAGLVSQYHALGFAQPLLVAHLAGYFEVLAGLSVLAFPNRPFLLLLFAWKMGTELFYPHWEVFEWIERGGSYTSILALWYCLEVKRSWQPQETRSEKRSPGLPSPTG